jgi:hypothetical protein
LVIPAPGRLRQENLELEVSLGHIVRPRLKTTTENVLTLLIDQSPFLLSLAVRFLFLLTIKIKLVCQTQTIWQITII